jgi:hypothetical protein
MLWILLLERTQDCKIKIKIEFVSIIWNTARANHIELAIDDFEILTLSSTEMKFKAIEF